MAEQQTDKETRKSRRTRYERRFEPASATRPLLSLVATILGGVGLGAGIYSQWLSATPLQQAPWIVGGGAVVLAATILWGDFGGNAVRVGDAGIALELPGQPLQRLNWNVISSITIKGGDLLVKSEERDISLSVASWPAAVAWVVKEASRRIPKKLDIAKEQRTALGEAKDTDGAKIPLEKLQVTGLKCRASGKIITFEKDARTCASCGEVYHRDHVPETCLTCDADMKK
jgi:hypothetical protein